MNKRLAIFIIIITVSAVSILTVNAASDNMEALKATFSIFVRGIEYQGENSPVVIEGRTYLPLRAIGDLLGVKVEWNEKSRRVEVAMSADEIEAAPSEFEPLNLKIENVSAQKGSTVEIPVYLENLSQEGVQKFDFELLYDTDVIEIVRVNAGSVVPDRESSFSFNTNKGILRLLFDPSFSGGGQYISSNGQIAVITAKIKDNAPSGKNNIRLIQGGYFEDQHLNALQLNFASSNITIQ